MEARGSAAAHGPHPAETWLSRRESPSPGDKTQPSCSSFWKTARARVASLPFLVGWGSHVGAQGLRACGSPCSPELQSVLGGEGGHQNRQGSPGLMRDHLTVPAPVTAAVSTASPSQPHEIPGCPVWLPPPQAPPQAAPQPPTPTCPQSSAHLPITLAVPRATAEPGVSASSHVEEVGPGLRWPQAGLCVWPSLLAAVAQGLTPDGPLASSAPHGSAHLAGGAV